MLTDETRRRDFPSLQRMCYLNTAAEGIPPPTVVDALAAYGRDKLLGMDGRPLHDEQRLAARALAAELLGLSPAEVSFCSCSSEAYNLAASALRLKEGDEVVINDLDFPAGATPWLQPACPASVRLWRARDGALRVEDLLPLLNGRTRLVTASLVSFYNGAVLPLAAVRDAIDRRSQSLLALDVTQALGRVPLELAGVDLVISSTHKWLLASHGGGVVGAPTASAERLTVPAGGWFNLENAFDADRFDRAVVKPGAASFSVGMPNYPALYALRAGLEYLRTVGVTAIDDYCRPLVRAAIEGLKSLPVTLLTPHEPGAVAGIVAFKHHQATRLAEALRRQNIHVMHHAGRIRAAVHGYNTTNDVERFLKTLHDELRRIT